MFAKNADIMFIFVYICRNCLNLHDENHFYPSNITSKTCQMNIQLIKSFEEIDSKIDNYL